MIGVAAMAEIQAKEICARFKERADDFRRITRWAECSHNLCLTKTAHNGLID
jgi:hypothetical protein